MSEKERSNTGVRLYEALLPPTFELIGRGIGHIVGTGQELIRVNTERSNVLLSQYPDFYAEKPQHLAAATILAPALCRISGSENSECTALTSIQVNPNIPFQKSFEYDGWGLAMGILAASLAYFVRTRLRR